MTDPRETSLPKWAQELITKLRANLATAMEPADRERRKREEVEKRFKRSQDVLAALHELLFTAAKGGHRTSQEIINVLDSYEVFPAMEDAFTPILLKAIKHLHKSDVDDDVELTQEESVALTDAINRLEREGKT